MIDLLPGFLAVCIVLRILIFRLRVSVMSPVYVLLGAYLFVLGIGGFIYDPLYGGGGGRFPISTAECISRTSQMFWIVSAAGAGAILACGRNRKSPGARKRLSVALPQIAPSTMQVKVALAFALASILLLAIGAGVASIVSRDEYLPEANHTIKSLGQSMLPVGVLGLGVAFSARRKQYRALAAFLAASAAAITLALNTRMFALVPVLFFGGARIIGTNRKSVKVGLASAILLAPVLIVIPLTGRSMDVQGIVALPELATAITKIDVNKSIHELANDLFISAPITVLSEKAYVSDEVAFLELELNPLPGFMTTWGEKPDFLLNPVTPFNAVGDLLRIGTLTGCCYFLLIGLLFGRLDLKIRASTKPKPLLLFLLALSYLFIVMSLQYPLRNVTRLIYYMIFAELLFRVAKALTPKSAKPGPRPPRLSDERFYCVDFGKTELELVSKRSPISNVDL